MAGPNQGIRCRERVIRVFTNQDLALCLTGTVLMEVAEAWTNGHRYFGMIEYWQWCTLPAKSKTPRAGSEAAEPCFRESTTSLSYTTIRI